MDCGNWQERQLSHNYSLKCCNEVCKLCSKPLKFISDGAPCAVKAARTVRSGGKSGDNFKGLPIAISLQITRGQATDGRRWCHSAGSEGDPPSVWSARLMYG